MTTLSANSKRVYELNEDPLYTDHDVIAADIIYEGSAVGESSSSGTARPLEGGDVFLGFAAAKVDNTSGIASDKVVRVRQRGTVKLSVASVALTDVGAAVYASDDDTFVLASTGNTQIGKVVRFISTGVCMVRFEAAAVRSI